MSFANLINLSKIESLGYSCTYLISYQQNDRPLETVTSQEEVKLSYFLKWFTLPVQASAIALEGFLVTCQE